MKLKCVIIDDDQFAVDALVSYVEQLANLQVFATYTDPVAALNEIDTTAAIDFIFLDIEMPSLDGLELAKVLRAKTRHLVFTTSHTQHAIAAFDLKASHYLLKPITFAKFALTVTELTVNEANGVKEATPNKKLQVVRGDSKNVYHFIAQEAINYIEAAGNYVIIYTSMQKDPFVTHVALNQVVAALEAEHFIRINKSNVIAKNAIQKVEGSAVILKDGKTLPLGEAYRPAFIAFLNDNLLQ